MVETINSIRLRGFVCDEPVYDHTIYGEAFYRIGLAVGRLSGVLDRLPVTVSERLLGDSKANLYEQGSVAEISGQIRSYNQTSGEKSRLLVTVFAREIELEEHELPFDDDQKNHEICNASTADISDTEYKNEAELCGSICKPVVYRTTPFGREIADILIAVNRRYGKSDYLPCIAWGRNARFADMLEVGDCIHIRGRMQSREYQKNLPDGTAEQRMTYEISCSAIEKRERW